MIESIKAEFGGVKRTFLPMQSILRIDEVARTGAGVSKISALEGSNVAQFPGGPVFTPPAGEPGSKK